MDSIEHFFIECPRLNNIWNRMENWFYDIVEVRIQINNKDIIFGVQNTYNENIITYLNFCILLTKHFIYKEKMANNTPSWIECVSFIKKEMTTKEEIAKINEKTKSFVTKWQDFANNL